MFKYLLICLFLSGCVTKNVINDSIKISAKNNEIVIEDNKKTYKIKNNVEFVGDTKYIVINDDVFIISLTKDIIKLSLTEKKIKWTKTLSTIPQSNFVFNNNRIYFNGSDNNFYVLDYDTGNIENIIFNTPVVTVTGTREPYFYNNKIVVFFANNEIYLVDANNFKVERKIFYKYSVDVQDNKIIIDNKEEIIL